MKRYYFSIEKFKKNERDWKLCPWIHLCDGKEVKDGCIVGTPFICTGGNVEKWCNCVDDEAHEKLHKFNVGDHVVVEKSNIDSDFENYAGKTGVIVGIAGNNFPYHVSFDEDPHNLIIWCEVKCLVSENKHKKSEETKIVITTDGKTTTAKLYNGKQLEKTAVAKCAPEDTFDFEIGARLAMARLIPEKQQPEETLETFYNGKVVCVESDCSWWTVGKVYTVVDGIITADDGDKYPHGNRKPYKDAEDIMHAGCRTINGMDGRHNPANTFIPLIE